MCFICPLSGLAVPGYLPGCRCISRMLTLVGCLQSLLQSSCFGSRTSKPPVLCHCSPCGPCQTSLSQEALEFISGSPPLPYCAVKSSSITYVVKRVWKLNLLPPLPVFFCHLWLQLLKECFCKRAPSSRGRKQTPSTVLFAHCPFWFFLSRIYCCSPGSCVIKWGEVELLCGPSLFLLSNSSSMALALRWWLVPQDEKLPSLCTYVFATCLQLNCPSEIWCIKCRILVHFMLHSLLSNFRMGYITCRTTSDF